MDCGNPQEHGLNEHTQRTRSETFELLQYLPAFA